MEVVAKAVADGDNEEDTVPKLDLEGSGEDEKEADGDTVGELRGDEEIEGDNVAFPLTFARAVSRLLLVALPEA
jgi:hypothetical protein